ncbi:hypothetical protein Tco_0749678 [Tanacetum coccineum]|uniref:Uncharacterized protein n=1 Tax=Tanacetum coccineum TaxID=301880 RepID=A0ABQ4Z1U1_9ASTR
MILKCVLNCFLNCAKYGFGFWDNLCAYDCYVNDMCWYDMLCGTFCVELQCGTCELRPIYSSSLVVDTDTESDQREAPSKAEESQPLGSRVPLMSEEFEASEPSGTRTVSSYSPVSSDSTAPLTTSMACVLRRPYSGHVKPDISEATTLSLSSFRKRYRSSYETPSSSSSSPTLLVQKRYWGTSELILDIDSEGDELREEDTEEDVEDESQGLDDESQGLDDESQGLDDEGQGLEDEGPNMKEEEEASPEGQHQAVLVVDIAGRAIDLHQTFQLITTSLTPIQTPPSHEWWLGSLPISPSSPVVPSPIALLVATPATTISVDEDQFIEVGAQLELLKTHIIITLSVGCNYHLLLVTYINRDVGSCILSQERLEMRSFHIGHVDTRIDAISLYAVIRLSRYDDSN